MNKLALALSTFIAINSAFAQSFKVVKIAGKKAIVEISDPKSIKLNETYNVGGSGEISTPAPMGKAGKRNNAIGVNFGMSNVNSITNTELGGFYLWNMKTYEVGPVVQFNSTSGGGISRSSSAFGAEGFYNFNENKPGVEGVLSAVDELLLSSGSGSSTTALVAGGNYRWFILSGDHCFSFSALYSTTSGSGTNVSGFLLSGGIITYF